ncbi:MAG TPA: biotin/lipoyl-containing protein [Candidatus Xenobia bacterium]|jgi:acetyl-CoA carboxylase biotin carboxyl carrier protein
MNSLPRSALRLVDDIIEAVGETDVTSLALTSGPLKIELKRSAHHVRSLPTVLEAPVASLESVVVPVTSELVGRFLLPRPVQRGDTVAAGDVVACIESMSLMNEVRAPVGGRIAEILVEPGHPVEFGQVLMALIPMES